MPVIGHVKLQEESDSLKEGRSTAAYLFNDKISANKFADAVTQYVKNAEVVDGNKKNQFKVRLQLNKDEKGKNKDTMKVVSLAQRNHGKIDIRESELLESIVSTVFFAPKARGLEDWSKDSEDAVDKGKEDDEEGNDIEDEEETNEIIQPTDESAEFHAAARTSYNFYFGTKFNNK